MKLFVSMGVRTSSPLVYGVTNTCEKGALILLDFETGETLRTFEYITPPPYFSPRNDMQLTAGSICNDHFIVPTDTEILFINLRTFKLDKCITLPSFNDLHYATVYNNNIYVANTGLDMIQVLDFDGNTIEELNAVDEPTWNRFSKDTDYRKVESTKPHKAHCNFVFFTPNGNRWITRLLQKDAICIDDPSKVIDLNVSHGGPHDGRVIGDYIYFTITDGYIVVVNANTFIREYVLDLAAIHSKMSFGRPILGWCRGIEVNETNLFVGFTKLRKSKSREYIRWIKHVGNSMESRIAQYSLSEKKLIKEVELNYRAASIYSIHCAP